MLEKVVRGRDESDAEYFDSLAQTGEMALKLLVAGMLSAVQEDRDRLRYRQVHHLVRSNGVGDWGTVLNEITVGSTATQLVEAARECQRDIAMKVGAGDWQYEAVHSLRSALRSLGHEIETKTKKTNILNWTSLFSTFRNKKAHGAPSIDHKIRLDFRRYEIEESRVAARLEAVGGGTCKSA